MSDHGTFVKNGRTVDAANAEHAVRLQARGWKRHTEPAPQVHVFLDGHELDPEPVEETARAEQELTSYSEDDNPE